MWNWNRSKIQAEINRIKTSLGQSGYGQLVDNLSGGITAKELKAFESEVGFAVPKELRELWSIHAGQRTENGNPIRDEEDHGFFGNEHFLGPREALEFREVIDMHIESLRENKRHKAAGIWTADYDPVLESGMSDVELESNEWICFAGSNYNWSIVNAKTGRVFEYEKYSMSLKLAAGSISEWLTGHPYW